jgi:hypothetical protein
MIKRDSSFNCVVCFHHTHFPCSYARIQLKKVSNANFRDGKLALKIVCFGCESVSRLLNCFFICFNTTIFNMPHFCSVTNCALVNLQFFRIYITLGYLCLIPLSFCYFLYLVVFFFSFNRI